ncbi:MAG: hypothetical protein A4E63_01542 [Syntrophorhabdus sp. PtaU1.Bin050]|nr:MAG: hypothetical protein A4E63_01542 [Syntrophorhabdus sp. PtaU1.Bin050]
MPSVKATSAYDTLLGEIKERIRSAQYEALKAVNKELTSLLLGHRQHTCGAVEGGSLGKVYAPKTRRRPTEGLFWNAGVLRSESLVYGTTLSGIIR